MNKLVLFFLLAVSLYDNVESCKKTTPVHCEWNDWKEGKCSKDCGTGTRTDTRTKKVKEKDGGTCSGSSTQTVECKLKECPVHCEWNDWKIGKCSKTCGGGTLTKTRTPKVDAKHGGNECPGSASIEESCNVDECPVDCAWNEWVFGECSVKCGGGIQPNFRVKKAEAMFGGTECEGEGHEEVECNTQCCPVNCEWGDWQFGECSVTCAGGKQTDTRTVAVEPSCGGLPCVIVGGSDPYATRVEDCNPQDCPIIHCEWEEWVIGDCSAECGTGARIDTRVKLIEEANGGTCSDQFEKTEECKIRECPVHCEWDDWQIGECSKTCGGGTLTKTRVEKVSAEHGGDVCEGLTSIEESCNVDECPVDCTWNEWTFEECTKTCGEGVMTKTRTRNYEMFGGQPCEGESSDQESCLIVECPVDCEWNQWEFGECSVTCAGGTRLDTRTKSVEEMYGGTCDPAGGDRTVPCNNEICPAIHCEWNDWVLGECSAECGTGTQTNTRTKSVEELNGGTCSGQPTEIVECKLKECPVHCEWEDWQIGECSKTCGGGTLTKTRVEKVSAEHGGDVCEGLSSIEESCNIDECPVDCVWGDYENTACSEICGGGITNYSRQKIVEEAFGGTCEGDASYAEDCNIDPCPVHCEWDEWNVGECSETCGAGLRINTRVKSVVESFGGTCDGQNTEALMCNEGECPVHCEWDEWVIGECSELCGGGTRTNTRQKKTEAAHGGEECTEAATLTESCNVQECSTAAPIVVCPPEKSTFCPTYAYWVPRYCVDIPENDWFLGSDGDYACKKSCGLC